MYVYKPPNNNNNSYKDFKNKTTTILVSFEQLLLQKGSMLCSSIYTKNKKIF